MADRKWVRAVVALGVSGILCSSAFALLIDGYSAAHNDRFIGGDISQPTPAFLGASYDLSGIAVNAGAVMISPHYFVTAAHTGTPGSLQFVAQDGRVITKAVASSTVLLTQGVSSDMRIGRLADDQGLTPDDHVSFYPVIVQPEQWYVGKSLFVYGQSNQAGVNTISFIDDGDFGGGASLTRVVGYYYDSADPYQDQAKLVGGDSGKPLGMIWQGQYTPLGSHFGVASASPTVAVNASSFIPYYVDQINAYMAPSGEQVTILPVPEPALIGIACAGAVTLLSLRRRTSD
jgi:hypothetical protein